MKLRIRENTLSLRLSKNEVSVLNETGIIANETKFPGSVLKYVLEKSDDENISCHFEENNIRIRASKKIVNSWIDSDQVGFEADIDLENDSKLHILVEKDFHCLTVRPGEDESDMFPNPLTSNSDK